MNSKTLRHVTEEDIRAFANCSVHSKIPPSARKARVLRLVKIAERVREELQGKNIGNYGIRLKEFKVTDKNVERLFVEIRRRTKLGVKYPSSHFYDAMRLAPKRGSLWLKELESRGYVERVNTRTWQRIR